MKKGRFGDYGGQYMPETLMKAVQELESAYEFFSNDTDFQNDLNALLKNYAGRPSLLYYAEKMTGELGGAKIYLKREDLNHTGSHKINNVLGQVLLAKRMGKTRVIAETGAGQYGVAAATAAALMDLECEIFMGKEDTERQALNVFRMELLGAIRGLEELKRPCDVILVTDSQYVMKGITEWMVNWKKRGWKTAAKEPVKNADLWKQLDEQVSRHNVTWKWVRGHIGHHGNERADQLANRGVDEVRGIKHG